MKKIANILILLSFSIVGFSFTLITNPYPFAASTQDAQQTIDILEKSAANNILERDRELRRLEEFNMISISIKGNIFYTQGNENKIEIDAPEEVQNNILTEIRKGKLIVEFKNKKDTKGEINVYITSKVLNKLSISGSADFFAEGTVISNEFEIEVAGSGDIKFSDLQANEVEASIAGSGNIVLESSKKADELEINIAGSGDVIAKKFQVKEAEINIAGSGNCFVNATSELEVNIAGSGDVFYQGKPEVESNIIGSGEVRREK